MFIASLQSLLSASSDVFGLSSMYRELVAIFAECCSVMMCLVFSGVSVSMWISVLEMSSDRIYGEELAFVIMLFTYLFGVLLSGLDC